MTALEVNIAVTVLSEDIVTLQAPVPEQAPVQPVKVYPDAGDSVTATTVFSLKVFDDDSVPFI